MDINDIRLTPEEIRTSHPYWNELSDNAMEWVQSATNKATDKAIEKMIEEIESKATYGTIHGVTGYVVSVTDLKKLVEKPIQTNLRDNPSLNKKERK